MSMQIQHLRTLVVTFDTAKHFIIPIETLFKRFNFFLHKVLRQHKLWSDAYRIVMVTRFSWYIASNTTIF